MVQPAAGATNLGRCEWPRGTCRAGSATGPTREGALAAELAAIAPDVVALQESWVEPDGATQADVLADRLGLHAVTAAELSGFDRYPGAPYWVVNALDLPLAPRARGGPPAARRAR